MRYERAGPSPADPLTAATAAEDALLRFAPTTAIVLLDGVLAVDPANVAAAARRVEARWMRRETPLARYELQQLLDRAPREYRTQLARGFVALGLRDDPALLDRTSGSCWADLAEAQAAYTEALSLDPRPVEAVRGLATILRLTGRPQDALALVEESLTRYGTAPGLLVERAEALLDQGRSDEALAELARAAEAAGAGGAAAEAGLQRTITLRMLGRLDEGFLSLGESLRRVGDPVPPSLQEEEGWLQLERLGDLRDPPRRAERLAAARAAFERAGAAEPTSVGVASGLAVVDQYEHGPAVAAARVERALDRDPDSPQLNLLRGHLTGSDAAKDRVGYYRAALRQAPYLTLALVAAATDAMNTGDLETARTYVAELERRHPGRPETLRLRSTEATARKDHATALELAERALALAPHLATNHARRADALLGMRCHVDPSGTDDLAASLDRWPGDVDLHWQKALRAEADGWPGEALDEYRAIHGLYPHDQAAAREERRLRRQLWRRPFYRMTWRPVEEAARAKVAPSPAAEADRLAAALGTGTRENATRRLRAARVREEQQTALRDTWDGNVGLMLLAAQLALPLPAILGWFGAAGHAVAWRVGTIAVMAAICVLAWWLALAGRAVVFVVTTVALSGVSLWALIGHPPARDVLLLAVAWPTAYLLATLLVYAVYAVVTDARSRRPHPPSAQGLLVRDLVALLDVLERQPPADWEDRTAIADLLESIAREQASVLQHVGRTSGVDGDRLSRTYVGTRSLGVAACTRDLKNTVLVEWRPNTLAELAEWARATLAATAAEHWGEFAWRQPGPLPSRVRSWLRRVVVAVVVLGTVGVGVALVVLGQQQDAGSGGPAPATIGGLLVAAGPTVAALAELTKILADRRPRESGTSGIVAPGSTGPRP